jgi:hypothetical protein
MSFALRQRIKAIAIILLIPVLLLDAAVPVLRWVIHSGEPSYRSAGPEIAALKADRGVNLLPAGATLLSSGSNGRCWDHDGELVPPALWRDFQLSGTAGASFNFYRSSLPAAGWTLTSDSHGDPAARTLSFSRSFGSWEAHITVSNQELLAEVDHPDFCTPMGGPPSG